MDKSFKSGFITILGQPNVGKSTLINKLVRQKIAIVSPKPQTTRNKIIGVCTESNYQMVFIDTPGIHKSKNSLDTYMEKVINNSSEDVDIIIYMLDAKKDFSKGLEDLEVLKNKAVPIIVVVNKIDDTSMERLYPKLVALNNLDYVKEILPISAQENKNLDVLKELILKYLPEGIAYYSTDEVTDISIRFLVSEIVREKTLWLLNEEIPHGIAVLIDKFEQKNDNLINISATIICERESHKKIIIGSDGKMLKKIGEKARLDIQRLLENNVFLELWVKVKPKWRDSDTDIINLGYNKKDISS